MIKKDKSGWKPIVKDMNAPEIKEQEVKVSMSRLGYLAGRMELLEELGLEAWTSATMKEAHEMYEKWAKAETPLTDKKGIIEDRKEPKHDTRRRTLSNNIPELIDS